MRYVYVADAAANNELCNVISKIVPDSLYSLIGGLRQSEFGLDTLYDVAYAIKDFRSKFVLPGKGSQFIDSGGYSIIKGDVSPAGIRRFIQCYNLYLENQMDNYERIFSLDIPCSLRYSSLNNIQTIHDCNFESLLQTRNLLSTYDNLRDKLYFVWHFKMKSQYKIWNDLYSGLELWKYIKHRAIGGMVGMRKATQKAFSPFTPIAYRCLRDFIEYNSDEKEFRLHYLGMYINYDRFQMSLLEKIFQKYLGNKIDVVTSYDSINYAHTARMGKNGPLFEYIDGNIQHYKNAWDIPDDILKNIYGDVYPKVSASFDARLSGFKLTDCNIFSPLFIRSNINQDRLFSDIIDKYELVDVVTKSISPTSAQYKVDIILNDISQKHPLIFSKKFIQSIRENIGVTILYDRWFRDSSDYALLTEHINRFLDWYGFPDLLR